VGGGVMSMQHEVLGTCEFLVDAPHEQPEGVCCGGPACFRVWCKDDKSDAQYLCFGHYNEVVAYNYALLCKKMEES